MQRSLNWKIVTSLFAMAFLVQGCGIYLPYSAKFRFIDVETHMPLQGVQGSRHGINDLYFRILIIGGGSPGTFSLPNSDTKGLTVAQSLTNDLQHSFTFKKFGYHTTHILIANYHGVFGELPPNDPHHEIEMQGVKPVGGEIVVPMYSVSVPLVRYQPVWTEVEVHDVPVSVMTAAEKEVNKEWEPTDRVFKSNGRDVRCYRNQYGDYRVIFFQFVPEAKRYQAEIVGIWPSVGVISYGESGMPGATPEPSISELMRQEPMTAPSDE